ncbi:DUF4381 domain-containing protein [Neorhodopirellula lusitana]|uniref:DUF4381 domain-containing protein n=1 Tax=Neorhodopirellula lusitana TaxID=445327 RepID=UPI003850BBEA
MQTPDPFSLNRLEDIVEPPPVPWWPPALGWYFVFAIVGLWTVWLAVNLWLRWQGNAYRRQGLLELKTVDQGDFAGLSTLLKRVALVAYSRDRVASLVGAEWTQFLTRTCRGTDFGSEPACRIGTASFEPDNAACDEAEWNRVTELTATWIREHVVEVTE